ncbi:Uncharacterised protein [Vibrio cholerae]|nr:Uncharacterised protein [Vibrio cholerae]
MVPPRSDFSLRSSTLPSPSTHSVIKPTTGYLVFLLNSVECAPSIPATLRAYSMSATCIPKQMPR